MPETAHKQRLPEHIAIFPVQPALPAPAGALLLRLQRQDRVDFLGGMQTAVIREAEIHKRKLTLDAGCPSFAERHPAAQRTGVRLRPCGGPPRLESCERSILNVEDDSTPSRRISQG